MKYNKQGRGVSTWWFTDDLIFYSTPPKILSYMRAVAQTCVPHPIISGTNTHDVASVHRISPHERARLDNGVERNRRVDEGEVRQEYVSSCGDTDGDDHSNGDGNIENRRRIPLVHKKQAGGSSTRAEMKQTGDRMTWGKSTSLLL